MKTIAQSYLQHDHCNMSGQMFENIARAEQVDVYSNNTRSWIEFNDNSVLDIVCGEVKAFRKLQRYHK
jgi:hypothetical protein